MKHLLNHIRKKECDIETVFKGVQADFQQLTAAALSDKMKPEYRSSLGKCLSVRGPGPGDWGIEISLK